MLLPLCIAALVVFAVAPHYLTKLVHYLKVNKILSDVVICYIAGMLIGNTKRFWLPDPVLSEGLYNFSEAVANYCVLLALPILIISSRISDILRNIRPVFFSFALMVASMIAATIATAWYYQGSLDGGDKAAAMLSAVYIGGSPNMFSVAKGLQVNGELLAIVQATDILCSGVFIVFMTSVARSFYSLFMPPYPAPSIDDLQNNPDHQLTPEEEEILRVNAELQAATLRRRATEFAYSASISVAIIAASTAVGILVNSQLGEEGIHQIAMMCALTTLGVIVSGFFGKTTSQWITTTESANYILLIFAVAAGSLADFAVIAEKGAGFIGFNAMIFGLALLLHFICGVIFRIKVDVLMVSCIASFFGPGFIPQISYVFGHNRLLAAGIAAGILGFILANYVGLGMMAFTDAWYP